MKKLLLSILMISLILGIPCIAESESHGGADEDKEVKVFLEDEFKEPFNTTGERWLSGWNQDLAGGFIDRGDIGTIVEDNSDVLPVILEREFENMTYGEAFMDIRMKFHTNTDGAEWVLRCDDKKIMGLTLADGNIDLFTPNGTVTALKNYKYNDYYYIKFDFDVDKQLVKGVYIDGKLVAENIPFVAPVSKINNFVMRTYDETKGRFMMDTLRIYRGYRVFEQFLQTSVTLSEDWENVQGVTKVFDTMLEFNGNQKVRKSYTRETRKTASDFYILMPKSRNGLEVSINDGEKKIAGISTTSKGFAYFTGSNTPVEFYEQFENVMYNFKLVTDFDTHTMEVYMNNRLMQSGIPLAADASGTDNITVESTAGSSIYFTTVKIYPVIEYDDYCPEPQAPPKDDIDIIMQMCPMWSEGYHFGYDHLNASPSRKPLLGFYDESDPEASDWTIKFMVEHGVDVRTSIWYRNGGINAPLREYKHTPQYKTMQNAKYADKMQWFILWDNSSDLGLGSADKNLDAFLKYIAPYWIEYYFKDPNYYKINGRPVIGAYFFWTIQGEFTQDTAAGLDKFRQLCVDAGVGEPLFWLDRNSDGDDSETHFKQMDKWGIDLQSQYHQNGKYIEGTKDALLRAKEYVVKNNLSFQTVPVVSPGFDDYAWGRSTGRVWDNDMLREMFEYVRDEYFEGLPTPTGRKMMLLATWDEYAEGHIFAPTVSNGFGYLDVLRDVFVGGEHTDILPTEHQYDRFNNRYPSWREAPYIWEKYATRDIPENSYIKMSWNFDTEGDFGGWEAESGFTSAEVKDGYLKCIAAGGTGKLTQNIDIPECEDILQIRIKYKNLGSAYNANLYYLNQFITSIPNNKSLQDHIKPQSEGELVFMTEKYPFDWKGRINKLQLQLTPFEAGDELYIDSIEVYARDKDESKIRLNLNDCVSETDGVRIGEDNAMIPIRDVAWAMKFDDRVHYDAETDTVKYRSYSDETTVIMPAKGSTFTINGKEYPSEGYYSCADGVCRISPLWAAEVFGKDSYYDSDSNTFYITDKSVFVPERDIEERELVYSADFESGTDGFNCGQYTSGTVENGIYKLKTMKGDPQFINHTIGESGIDCNNAKIFAIKTTVEKECMIKVYFSTTQNPAISEGNAFYFYVPASPESQIFSIDVSDWANWEGTLTYMRIDAEYETDNSFDIDWIRLYGDFETEITEEYLANKYVNIDVGKDGTAGICSETTVMVTTNDVEIDFKRLETLPEAVTVSNGSTIVEDFIYDKTENPYSYSFTLTGLARQTTYTVTVRVPLMYSDMLAKKTFKFTTVSNYEVLDSIEYEGYTWDVGPTSGESPETGFNRKDVLYQFGSDHTVVGNGIMTMEAGIKPDGTNYQSGTVTEIGKGLHTKDIKRIQMRVRVSGLSQIKLYYKSNLVTGWAEGDAVGNRTMLAQETVPADGAWHIINMIPTSDIWVNNADHVLSTMRFLAIGAEACSWNPPEVFEIDWIRYMGEGAVQDTGSGIKKYGFDAPTITKNGTEARVKVPSFVNYSSHNVNLGLIAASYDGGKLKNIKYANTGVAAGMTAPEIETVLSDVGENEEIKAYLWDMSALKPLDPNEMYDIFLPKAST